VGIHDNFFALGGDSILAAQIISRLREAMRVELSFLSFIETPTIAGMVKNLETCDRKILALPTVARPPLPDNQGVPVSYAQERFLKQPEPGHAAHTRPTFFRLTGRLDVASLRRSLDEIVRRHDVLRTSFSFMDGQWVQFVSPPYPVILPVVDLSGLSEPRRSTEARRLSTEEAERPFDLARGPLLRATLLRLKEDEHMLLLAIHHIAFDGWSQGVLLREIGLLYPAFCLGKSSPLPDLSVQYTDFAVWQRQWLKDQILETQLSYWKKQLAGIPGVLSLRTDRSRPAVQTFKGARESIALSPALTKSVKLLSQRTEVSLFMTLLAAFQTLLYRYTGQEDIVVGSPIANRNRTEIEGLIGFFVNTLVLRANLSGHPTFKELLAGVKETTLAAYAHQDLPFDKLVEELEQTRDLSRAPFSQVRFVFHNGPSQILELSGLDVSAFEVDSGTAKSDWTLYMSETGQGLVGSLEYNTELFETATIMRVLGHFQTLLESVVADPDQRVSDLPFLTEAERDQLLVEWNETKRDYPMDRCVPQLFEAQVKRTPDALAVVFEDRRMTYRELSDKANAIALELLDRGIGKGSYVPFLMDRSIEVVICMLAIMKTGAAFVPLDIHWPTERLKQLLDDLNSRVILANHTTPYDEGAFGRFFLHVDEQAAGASRELNLNVCVDSEQPVYAIYTSGSTGKAKAAVVPHRGITNRFLWMNEFFGCAAAAAALQTTYHVYDSAVWQLFWPLINGGKSIIPSRGMETNADYLAALIERHEVTITDFVPSVFNTIVPQLVHDGSIRKKLRSLRTIIVGGEEITPSTTYRFMADFPGVRVINLYGPTEASIGCICHEVTGKEDGQIPIGRPISNVQVLILDGNRNLVPVGVAGELYLSGACLGLGYLNDEGKTKAAFVDNGFPEIGCKRLYKTGDLARYLPDGNIEFLGRIDHQVKIRGFRVEPGEIEATIGQHPAVRQAMVLAREDILGDKCLVAHVVLNEEHSTTTNELRSFLRQKLPGYMVPAKFVISAKLPVISNGKFDRKAVLATGPSGTEREEPFVAPRTPIERTLAQIWADVLKLDAIGIHENFFDLGGHSLLATQIISRVRDGFSLDFPLRALFEDPTVAGLAARIAVLQTKRSHPKQLAEVLASLESCSDEEAELLLSQENSKAI
jgi:amino acid adenylation domain-containing protein